MVAANKKDLMQPPLQWSKEQLANTPSIQDGFSAADEGIERYLSCIMVRDLIREVFKAKECDSLHVQILGCYYLQLFYMFQSMKNFDARGAVAIAAARLACKMYDEKPRGGTMYLELERQRIQRGQGSLSEEEKKDLRQQASEIEIFLLRLTKFETDIALPCDEMEELVEKTLVKLSCESQTFKKECGDKSPVAEAQNLRAGIVRSSRQFLGDSFMGLLPLRFSRRCASWSAILFALRYAVRKIPMPELLGIMEQANADDGIHRITRESCEAGFQEIITVFKIKSQAAKREAKAEVSSAAAAAPAAAAPPTSSAPLPPATAPAVSAATAPAAPQRPIPRERSRSRER